MIKKFGIPSALTALIIFVVTTALFLYTSGYRLDKKETKKIINFTETGMVSAKSIPDGATVYMDGALNTATNGTISGVAPGTHNLRIVKKGFVDWSKNIEVFPQLVTDITAVLISQSPRLEPLTNTGAKVPSISHSLSKLAYFSKDGTASGVWIIPLTQSGLSLFRSPASVILEDTATNIYSNGQSIKWSPDEKELLIADKEGKNFLLDLDTKITKLVAKPDDILKDWSEKLIKKRADFIEKLDLPEDMKALAISQDVIWSPDEKKFLYTHQNAGKIEYRVFNMEKPIPIGERTNSLVFEINLADPKPKITWYSDSFHLILTEKFDSVQNRAIISLIRIDGTNKTEIYNNTTHSDSVFSAPSGDKVIIITSFKSTGNTDLYTIGIR